MTKYSKGLVYGWGINDADYKVLETETISGKLKIIWRCPYYLKWRSLLSRSLSEKVKADNPTYLEATTNVSWKYFSNFKRWMETQIWEGLHLDKDILVMGNKEYGPDTCVFVPEWINTLIPLKSSRDLPVGVCRRAYKRKDSIRTYYVVQISDTGAQTYAGFSTTPEEAHKVWQLAKADIIEKQILRYMLEPCYRQDVANALYERAEMLRNHAEQGIETTFL